MEKKQKLFLDDERKPSDVSMYLKHEAYKTDNDWEMVKNFEEFRRFIIDNEMPEMISFDHDLDHEHYPYAIEQYIPYSEFKIQTGYHCLLWLVLYCKENGVRLPEIMIHTMNREGENNMRNLIDAYYLLGFE